MHKIYITRLSDSEFHFEYEDKGQIKQIEALTEFEHEGQRYKVTHKVETFDLSGYHAFLVTAEKLS